MTQARAITRPSVASGYSSNKAVRHLVRCVVAALALIAWAAAPAAEPLSATSAAGHYRVQLRPLEAPVPINAFHDWELRITSAEGEPLDPRQLAVFGGMPGHGHGLPSSPEVTERLEPGLYRVSGMRFNMAGLWELFVGVTGPAGPDKARFEIAVGADVPAGETRLGFSADEVARMQTLVLKARPPADTGNRLIGNADAIALGRALFSDVRLSATGAIACATCHVAGLGFADGRKLSHGSLPLKRNAPSLLGAVHADWFYWDGRRDSLWAQTLTPIETRGEMDNTRSAVAKLVLTDADYRERYARLAKGPLPKATRWPDQGGPFGDGAARTDWQRLSPVQRRDIDTVFSDVGKALAAFVATLQHRPTRFDAFALALAAGHDDHAASLLDEDARAGLKLFLDEPRSKCLRCHNGSTFTSYGFHNIGTATDTEGQLDFGRAIGIRAAQHDPFNCLGEYSDVDRDACDHHRFADAGHPPVGAFKVPSLRGLDVTAPYMHDGRFASLEAVVAHYRAAAPAEDGSDDLFRLDITDAEAAQLVAFLRALSAAPEAHSNTMH
ncbi:MAG: cytochrome c peroxidase [Pseudomonadota bacterium]